MDKVISLVPGQVVPGQPDPEIVEMLETFLEQAKRGEIDGIGLAISRPNGVVMTGFWFGNSAHRLTAATSMLWFDVNQHVSESGSEKED